MFSIRTAKQYCKDDISKIPGYTEAVVDDSVWELHHTLELTVNGEYARSMDELIRLGMYYKRPYFELIFLPKKVHQSMHLLTNNPSRVNDESTRKKISCGLKGHYGWNKGKTWSDKTRELMRNSHLGKHPSDDVLAKIRQIACVRKEAYKSYRVAGGALSYNGWSKTEWYKIKESLCRKS